MSRDDQYTGPLTGDLEFILVTAEGIFTYEGESADLRTQEGQQTALEVLERPFWRTKESALAELVKTLARLDPPQLLLV